MEECSRNKNDYFYSSNYAACIAGVIGVSLLPPELFGIYDMSNQCVMLLLAFSIAMGPGLRYFTRLNEIIQGLYKKHQQKRYKKH